VFQDPFSSLDPRMRVHAIVKEALRHDRSLPSRQKDEETRQALESVGLKEHGRRYPHELSGGQRQRVAIARAIVSRPDVVVADEPISALDMTIQKQVLELFERLQREQGFACIFISHDLAAVQQIAQRIIVMEDGRIVETGSCEAVFADPQHEYTRRLLAASPMLTRSPTRGNEKRKEPVND
jgi:peptide/nickel transport system ATP-binding protein